MPVNRSDISLSQRTNALPLVQTHECRWNPVNASQSRHSVVLAVEKDCLSRPQKNSSDTRKVTRHGFLTDLSPWNFAGEGIGFCVGLAASGAA
jgi:hypothetical protein